MKVTETSCVPGGWAPGDESYRETLAYFTTAQDLVKARVRWRDLRRE